MRSLQARIKKDTLELIKSLVFSVTTTRLCVSAVAAINASFDGIQIYTLSKKDGGKHLYEVAHKEVAFTKTPFAESINYIHAKHLLI